MNSGLPTDQAVPLGASFRDPSGFLFRSGGTLYRQVNLVYRNNYERLMDTGLYQELVNRDFLIPHLEVDQPGIRPEIAYKILQPELIHFISYPYEWAFSQLKDAALLTLQIQKIALDFGMALKDSSAYNIQFQLGQPVLIDTLSFEIYPEGSPWVAYRQFCQHFLAPLSLMAFQDVRLSQLFKIHIDGIPLDLCSHLLPFRTRLKLPLLFHIHLHAASQKRYASTTFETGRTMSKVALLGLIDSLEAGIQSLRWEPAHTEWADYYTDNNYTAAALEHKKSLVSEYLGHIQPTSVWDLGANVGIFSRLASERGITTVAFDIDPAAVERNYLTSRQRSERHLLPLVQDLVNPSSNLGWHSHERLSLLARAPAGALMALALVHHLAISNNVPLDNLARFFHSLARWLIIEFVPKSDSQVQRLFASREDIFPDYTREGFEQVFSGFFRIQRQAALRESDRWLYLMEAIPFE